MASGPEKMKSAVGGGEVLVGDTGSSGAGVSQGQLKTLAKKAGSEGVAAGRPRMRAGLALTRVKKGGAAMFNQSLEPLSGRQRAGPGAARGGVS